MFYILDKNGRVIATACQPVDVGDLASRGEILVTSELNLPLDQVEAIGLPAQPVIAEKKVRSSFSKIILTTTAKDTDGDGLPELPADGKSKRSITATLQDAEGNVINDPIEVQYRTSAGTLSSRSITAEGGKATVQLTSSRETVMATVYAFTGGFEPASLGLEFVPVQNA